MEKGVMFGLSMVVIGVVGFGLISFYIILDFFEYQSSLEASASSPLALAVKLVEIENFEMLFSYAIGRLLPLCLLAICLGASTYTKLLTPLLKIFIFSSGGFLITFFTYLFITEKSFFCGSGSDFGCTIEIIPNLMLVPVLGYVLTKSLLPKS